MDRLDACYFCGTAGGAPLREVSIAPRGRRGDPAATVATTLCPSCESKLETVLGRLFDHVESRRIEDGTTADGPASADGDERGPDVGEGATVAERSEAADGKSAPVDRIDVSGESADRPPGTHDRDRLFDPAPDIAEGSTPGADEDQPPPTGEAAPAAATGEESTGSADDDPNGDDSEILEGEDEPTVRARASATPADPLDGVSVAEYNRVMRLLQNRDFPMARAAFVDLASSAYDLAEGPVEEVLEAVIEKGALDERDGDLVRPDGSGEEAP